MTYIGDALSLPGLRTARRAWNWIQPYAASYIGSSPATFLYAGAIFATTWIVRSSPHRLHDALLRQQSTNLSNLATRPVNVLVGSAFWSGFDYALPVIAVLALILSPAEAWLGTPRVVLVFAIGHIGATLMTAAVIVLARDLGRAPAGIGHTVDVGVSYGTICVAAILTYRLPGRWRYAWALALLATLSALVRIDGDFTDYGHLVAASLGLACYPLTRRPAQLAAARIPLYRPWKQPQALEI